MPKLDVDVFIEKLSEKHTKDLLSFSCGHSDMDGFAHKDLFVYQKQNIGVSYVLLDKTGKVLSFITLLTGAIKLPEHLKFEIPQLKQLNEVPNQLPALKIGRLGTRKEEQKKGYAKLLISYATYLAKELQEKVGCYFLILDAYPDNITFYQKYRFTCLYSDSKDRETIPMFREISAQLP